MFGAAEESRTLDLNLGKVALYQLSYCRDDCFWRRVRESNPRSGICNPEHSHYANAPHSGVTTGTKKGKPLKLSLVILERQKSLELSTSTLARLRSTN
jgi:hypothetical protein